MIKNERNYIHSDITEKIIGEAYVVYNSFGGSRIAYIIVRKWM